MTFLASLIGSVGNVRDPMNNEHHVCGQGTRPAGG
jgi:hypothetical protein